MAFTAKDVQALREATSCGILDCKKALTEANGDMDTAVKLLREKGLAASQKKAGRVAAEGAVWADVSEDGKSGVVLEVNSETDFVAANDKFMSFVKECATTILATKPSNVDTLMTTKLGNRAGTVEEELRELILVIGENIKVRRFERYDGLVGVYVHGGGRIGVMVEMDSDKPDVASKAEFKALLKDVAMQVAALSPQFVNESEVTPEVLEKEKAILLAQLDNDPKLQGKPEQAKLNIIKGRLDKLMKEICLTEQSFFKSEDQTVGKYVESVAQSLGAKLSIKRFVRFERGEGIEKKDDNFADEVASMIK